VRALGRPIVAFSAAMKANDTALKTFLFKNMYRHYKVNRMLTKAKRVVAELFQLFLAEPGVLPTAWDNSVGHQVRVRQPELCRITLQV